MARHERDALLAVSQTRGLRDQDQPMCSSNHASRPPAERTGVQRVASENSIRNRENTRLCFALHVGQLVYIREQIP